MVNRVYKLYNSIKKQFKIKSIKETTWSFATKGQTFILFVLINLILARELGPVEFGQWSSLFALSTILAHIGFLGINKSVKKFAAQYNYTNSLLWTIQSSLIFRIILSFLYSSLLFIIFKPLIVTLNSEIFTSTLHWVITFIFFLSFTEYFKLLFEGLHNLKYNFILNILEYGSRILIIFIFIFLNKLSFETVIKVFALSEIISTAAGIFCLLFFLHSHNFINQTNSKYFFIELLTPRISSSAPILKYAFPFVFLSTFGILNDKIDILMLNFLSSNETTGTYTIAKDLVSKLTQIALAIGNGTLPVFAKLDQNNKKRLYEYLWNILKKVNITFLILGISINIIMPIIVLTMLGEEYKSTIPPLRLYSIHLIQLANIIILGQLLNYLGKAHIKIIIAFGELFINIGLNLLLIPSFAAIGVVSSKIIAATFTTILLYYLVQKEFK